MRRPVLALHPSLAHGGAFAALAATLPALDFTAPDMIGHGRAAPWDGHSDLHSACTRDAIAQAEAMVRANGGPIDIIGHSFGATVALRLALERPELLRAMVLIEPVLFAAARADEAPEYRAYAAQHDLFAALMDSGDLDAAAGEFQRHWGDGRTFAALPAATRAYITHRLPLVAAQTGALVGDSGGIMGYLRLESCPTPALLLRGTNSPPIIAAIHRALAARLPNAREVVISGAAHMLPMTHPDQTARALQGFWHGH
ncbi:MAG: alpha/beta fold hydrolase [Cypionkella sp.]|nr:alpha/beta fold hydrolase [Cypionkella sp.]